MEEKEETGYRSPTCSILRALQTINKTKRLEDEAVMSAPLEIILDLPFGFPINNTISLSLSAPPFFQLAVRGDPQSWGEDDGPIVVVRESLSESEQNQWLKKMGRTKDWVTWCRSREKDEEQRLSDVDGKEIFSNHSKQAKP